MRPKLRILKENLKKGLYLHNLYEIIAVQISVIASPEGAKQSIF